MAEGSYNDLASPRMARAGARASGGKLHMDPDDPTLDPTLAPGFWVGPAMMANLFTREHNAVCDRLGAENPFAPWQPIQA